MRAHRPWSFLVTAALLVTFSAGLFPSEAQRRDFGRVTVPVPERTDAGRWEGTWYYVSRDMRMAMWIRETGKVPQIKIRFLGLNKTEAFTTDWDARAEYDFRGKRGRFSLDFDTRDENTLSGTWNWRFGPDGEARIEHGRFEMFRTSEGRRMALHLTDFERIYESPEGDTRLPRDQVRTFVKASQFQALWTELPF